MTKDQARRHRENLSRLDRQLAIAGDDTRPQSARHKAARWAASLAEKLGMLIRPGRCQWCRFNRPLERHHPSYDDPLHIMWLCCDCHCLADAMHGTAAHRPRAAS